MWQRDSTGLGWGYAVSGERRATCERDCSANTGGRPSLRVRLPDLDIAAVSPLPDVRPPELAAHRRDAPGALSCAQTAPCRGEMKGFRKTEEAREEEDADDIQGAVWGSKLGSAEATSRSCWRT